MDLLFTVGIWKEEKKRGEGHSLCNNNMLRLHWQSQGMNKVKVCQKLYS